MAVVTNLPYLQKPEEEQQAERDATNLGLRKFFNSTGSMMPALLMPDRQLPGVAGYIPGAGFAEGLIGMGGAMTDAAATLSNAGLGTHFGGAPDWMRAAGEHLEQTRSGVQDFIAAHTPLERTDPNDPNDRTLDIVGSTLGGIVPIVPGGAARALTSLVPRGAKTIAGFIAPSTESLRANIPIATGIGLANAGLAGLGDTAHAATPQAAPSGGAIFAEDQPQPTQSTDSIGLASVLRPTQAQPASPNLSTDGASDIGLTGVFQGMQTPPAPTFGATGYTGMTVGQALGTLAIGAIAIGAGKYFHGTSRVINDVDRTARFNNPEYAGQAADYNNERILRGGSEISPAGAVTQPTPPPLPEQNKFRRATNYVNDQLLNSNAQMQDAIRMSADPTTSEALAHTFGVVHDDIRWKTKLGNFLETGRDVESGVSIPSPVKLMRDFADVKVDEPDRYKVLNDALHAWDEKDNRFDNAMEFRRNNPGKTPTPDDIRHNFKNQDDAQLDTIIQRAEADPQLKDMMDRFFQVSSPGMVRIGQAHGFFTPTEVTDLLRTHPHHVPEALPGGETKNPMQRRDRTIATGTDQVNSHAIYNLAQHIDELYQQIHLNDLNRRLRSSYMKTQRDFPGAAQFMYDVPSPAQGTPSFYSGGQFREPVVTIRNATGPTFTRIDHPDWFNAMSGNSLRKREVGTGLLTLPRRMYTYMTTGVGSLVSGRIAPLANVGYTTATMGINAPKGSYGGLLDRIAQRNLPANVANVVSPIARGIDTVTTTPIGVGYSYFRGVGDRWIGRAARIIEQGQDNWINNYMRAHHGDAYVNTWQDTLQRVYEATKTAQKPGMGIGGMGIPVATDLPSLQIPGNKQASLLAAHLVPKLFFSEGAYGKGHVVPIAMNLNRAVSEAMGHLSDAGHDYFANLNWDNPNLTRDQLTYETRNLTGNPGQHGSNELLRKVTSVLPYANIGLQGTARLGRSIGERPVGAPMTMATALGSLALIELLTHMRSHEHMDYYENELSTQQRAANFIFATGSDPRQPTMIPVAQELRAPKAFMTELVAKVMNIAALQHDPDAYKNIWNGIVDFLGSHVSMASRDSVIHGAVDAVDFANLPPYAGHMDWNGKIHGKALVDSYRSPINTRPQNLPNQVPDGPLDSVEGKVFGNLLQAVFGLAAVSWEGAQNVSRYAEQTGSWSAALGMSGHDWIQGMEDRNPQFNFLWEHQVRLGSQAPIVEQTERKLYAINKIPGARTDVTAEGQTSRSRYAQPVPMSNETKIPTDPTMQGIYYIAEAYKSRMTSRTKEITELKKQLHAVDASGMDVTERREWMNDQQRRIADKYRLINAMVADMEYAMSTRVGRPIHIEDVDWQKGPEQFN
jgi:hypothetical protein